jgi:hypothetical protein
MKQLLVESHSLTHSLTLSLSLSLCVCVCAFYHRIPWIGAFACSVDVDFSSKVGTSIDGDGIASSSERRPSREWRAVAAIQPT